MNGKRGDNRLDFFTGLLIAVGLTLPFLILFLLPYIL